MKGNARLCLRLFALWLYSLIVVPGIYGDVKRSRSEGLVEVRASNTEGFSNIWIFADTELRYIETAGGTGRIELIPRLGGKIGLASLMQLSGSTGVPKGRTLGTTQLHVQITTPGNNNLRLLGLGVSGDLMLSSVLDTVDGQEGAPRFVPYPGFTAMLDLDLIKKMTWLPLKLYANVTNLDDEKLLPFFEQISIRGGLEYKGSRNSLFVGGNLGIYKERPANQSGTTLLTTGGSFDQFVLYASSGLRWRIGQGMNLVGRLNVLLGSIGTSPLLPKRAYALTVSWEAPLYFKDTDTEAVRTLIFVEKRRKSMRGTVRADTTAGPVGSILPGASTGVGTSRRIFGEDYYKRREELKRHRQQALKEMEKIEEMLK